MMGMTGHRHRKAQIWGRGRLQISRIVYLALCSAALGACATVTKGMHETITVATEPPSARAYTDILKSKSDIHAGYIGCEPTPCSFKLARRSEAVILIEHDDYTPYEAAVFSDHRSERRYREKKRLKEAAARDIKDPIKTSVATNAVPKAGTTVSPNPPVDTKDPLIRGNVVLGGATSTGVFTAASIIEYGTIIAPPLGAGALIGGSMILFSTAGYTLAADTTDAVTGANHSLYPNPVFVRLAKDPAQYSVDPNVVGVRQRRSKPSPKAPLHPDQP